MNDNIPGSMTDKTIQTMVDGVNKALSKIDFKQEQVTIDVKVYTNLQDGFENIDFDMMREEFEHKLQDLEDDQDVRRDIWNEKQKDYANDSR